MLYLRNRPFTPSMFGKRATLRYLPCLSHVWPACIPHTSWGILRHCPIHFHYSPFPTAHYHTITGQKWFCACILVTLSTRPQAITTQTDWVMPGYWPLSSSSWGPRLSTSFFVQFLLFCFFYQFSFYFYIDYKFFTTTIFFG